MINLISPIKWTGGKGKEIKYFEYYIPKFKIYVEPFLGGGALFWHLKPKKAVLNDINYDLINFFIQLRDNYDMLIKYNNKHEHNKDYFNNIVCKLNTDDFENKVERASAFYYINKTCFSGKWRVNSKGEFNNTWGNYKTETYRYLDKEYSLLLQGITILNKDFKYVLLKYMYNRDAFIFLDPPYLDCDTMYVANTNFKLIYDYLSRYILKCKCKVLLVVKNNEYIENTFKDFIVKRYTKKYCHNSTSNKKHEHLVICNYTVNEDVD